MKLYYNNLLLAFSNAFDHIEKDYFKVVSQHGKRVAILSMLLGEYFDLDDQSENDLIGYALLHDNGLTEYYKYGDKVNNQEFLKIHCNVGEQNIALLPFFHEKDNIIKYHHEKYNGEGPFHIKGEDIPLYSQIIHMADYIDVEYDIPNLNKAGYQTMMNDMEQLRQKEFSNQIIDAFIQTISFKKIQEIQNDLDSLLKDNKHQVSREFTNSQLFSICNLFARIIDSKSPHTRTHSIGVASIATKLAQFYNYDEDMLAKIFFAGAMHDVGKLVIDRDILEKPEKLTNQEYAYIQTHVYYTYKVLTEMDLGDIVGWASYHHEKLDGSGYPFGKKAEELDFNSRLMACCDIYQALTENRPYKKSLSHVETISIMRSMVEENKIDGQIVEDMNILFGN
ncbi:MAG: HD domain-containing phosphohydrolase [Coprobacillus sp.]